MPVRAERKGKGGVPPQGALPAILRSAEVTRGTGAMYREQALD
jgi:hypothetical protein